MIRLLLVAALAVGLASAGDRSMAQARAYDNTLRPNPRPLPILADHPLYVAPLEGERRLIAAPVIEDEPGDLLVRSWRYSYNARGIVEMVNRLSAKATALIVVHPWGVDDGSGLRSPDPAGCAFGGTPVKNRVIAAHAREVLAPLMRRLRGRLAVTACSMPGSEDPVRKLLYRSVAGPPSGADLERGRKLLADALAGQPARAGELPRQLALNPGALLASYFAAFPGTSAGDDCNGPGFWSRPMPVSSALGITPQDVGFYDDAGYPRVRDYLKGQGVRHVLLCGYCADICLVGTPCGYQTLSADFDVFVVGDGVLASFPASSTPRYATQAAVCSIALGHMVTQASWIGFARPPAAGRARIGAGPAMRASGEGVKP